MINCTVVPLTEYSLYDSYGNNPELFNLISRTCTAMFSYEPGLNVSNKLYILKDSDLLLESLVPEVCELLYNTDPWEMYLEFKTRFPGLPLMSMYQDPELLLMVMKVRALQWRKLFRGKVAGNEVKFGSDLTKTEDEFLVLFLKNLQEEHDRRLL